MNEKTEIIIQASTLGPEPNITLAQSNPVLDGAYYVMKNWVIYGIFAIGFVGNVISCLITNKEDYKHITTCVYMTSLAILDIIALLAYITYNLLLVQGLGKGIGDRQNLNVAFVYLIVTSMYASRLVLAAMTVDRACRVLIPLKAKAILTISGTKKIITSLTVIPTLANINLFFTVKVFFAGTKDEMPVYSLPEMPWVEVLITSWTLFIAVILPFLTILISNILIIYGVRRASKERNKMAAVSDISNEGHLTRMLILVSAAYIVLCLPDGVGEQVLAIPGVSAHYDMDSPYWKTRIMLINYTLGQISVLNHAVNFYLYVLGGGRKYRQDVRKVFSTCF